MNKGHLTHLTEDFWKTSKGTIISSQMDLKLSSSSVRPPDTQGDPHCPLINTLGLGIMAAPPIHQDSQHAPGSAQAQGCDLPKAVVHPFLILILPDEGKRSVRPTDHPEGLGRNTITSTGNHAKRTDPKEL